MPFTIMQLFLWWSWEHVDMHFQELATINKIAYRKLSGWPVLYNISIESLAFLPSITKKGKWPVRGCILVLHAMQTGLKWDSYICLWTFIHYGRQHILIKLGLELSTYGVVLDFFQGCSHHFLYRGSKFNRSLFNTDTNSPLGKTIGHNI